MAAEIIRIPSCDGAHELAVYRFIPKRPAAVVQIVHGMAEHIGRYEEFAEFLNMDNIAVIGHDHLGHGKTAASKEELGFISDKKGWELLVDDSMAVTAYIKNELPDLPAVLFGHSMGSLVVRNYISRDSSKLCGCILSGNVQDMPGIAGGIVGIIAKFTGARKVSKLLDDIAFGSYCKRIHPKRTDKDWLTRDEAIVDKYIADDYSGFSFTSSAMKDLVTLNCNVSGKKWIKTIRKDLPVHLFSGGEDPCGGYGKGVIKIYNNLCAGGIKKVENIIYPYDRHELLNELDREQVMKDMLTAVKEMTNAV